MIDEKKLIEEINEKLCADCSECYGHCKISLIEEIINEQPKVSEWIPVSEQQPPKDELVLWCGKKGGMFIGSLTYYYEPKQEAWCYVPNSRSNRTGVAWTPLPEPYNKEKEN